MNVSVCMCMCVCVVYVCVCVTYDFILYGYYFVEPNIIGLPMKIKEVLVGQ